MRCAFADPPYLGEAKTFNHPRARVYDTLAGHLRLVGYLEGRFPDGWAYSLSVPSLRKILPHCPARCRVGAWVKPFVWFKPWVNPAYSWEPVLFAGGRKRGRGEPTVKDSVVASATNRQGCRGAKPEEFCRWLFELLGLRPGDTLVDLFPGSGAVGRAWERYQREGR